ncbi:MAG: MFS transporter [Propionibacteriaceae bacterium]|jgi:OPA family glycerol-3-phosphate transporter-like MFS transporter|nr:MFS transporter [Propionibacteriaceae bacterium]
MSTPDHPTPPVSKGIFAWLAAPPPLVPALSEAEARRIYPSKRLQVFLGIFFGYAAFYLIRNNVSLVAAILNDEAGLSKTGIGIIANAVLIAYGFSKFFSATISDRSNARYFLPIGLALSALTNFVVAFTPGVATSVGLFATLMFINGWFQGMGWPPSGRVLVHWFSTNERGWKTAIWNCAHNIGGVGLGALAALGLSLSGQQWQAAFWLPAIVALIVAVIVFFLIRDTPASIGLPPIEQFRNDPPKVETDPGEASKLKYWQIVLRHVVLNPTMVFLALANVFIYALRYGITTWTPTYLTQHHQMSVVSGIAGFSLFELSGIVGTLVTGWVSDHVFRGNRSTTGMAFLGLFGVCLVLYWLSPVGTPGWLLMTYLALMGACIYGPVMLIGLQALDMSARHVAGTAAGFTGLFGYVLGATMASSLIGWIVDHMGWNWAYILLVVCVGAAIGFLVAVLPREKTLIAAHDAKVAARR